MRRFLIAVGPIPVGLAVCVWWLVLFLTLGGVDADYGNFVTVAERLLAGDRLYVDVYENKDPLFQYLNAASRAVSPLGTWWLGFAFVGIAAVAVWHLLRGFGMGVRPAFVVGAIVTPIVLTGAAYFPGSSHLPGVAVLLVSLALASRGRWLLAGIALGMLVWLKVVLLPVALAALIVLLIAGWSTKSAARLAVGAAGAALTLAALVALRGELAPYAANLIANTQYSSYASGGLTGISGLVGHLSRVMDTGNLAAALCTLLLLALTVAFSIDRWRGGGLRASATLAAMSTASLAAGMAVLAFTGLWGHHALALAPAALLALGALLLSSPERLASASPVAIPAIIIIAFLLAALPNIRLMADSLLYARGNIQSHLTPSAEALAILASGPPTTYARVGNSRDQGHAFGLRDWRLACPKFAEETWEPELTLEPKAECLPTANVILITADVTRESDNPAWTAYVDDVESVVANGYRCTTSDVGRVCRKAGT